jgi:Na+-transporting methylmalonyl-CoA/oxaloacetate decarboxylase gamma subunit
VTARSRGPSVTIKRRRAHGSRRQFLQRSIALLLVGAALSAFPTKFAFSDADDARADAQWARLKRGLSPKAMAGCRKAAERLAPRMGQLLKGPQWEAQTFRAIAAELKQAGVYPDRPPAPGLGCPDGDALRGEAESIDDSGGGSIGAGLSVAAAATAGLPGIGTVIAAVLALIAAVLVMIGQIIAKALEDQAAAKEGEDAEEQVVRLKKARSRVVAETESRDDCTLFGKKPD